MLPLKLKVYMIDDDRRIENFTKEQWDTICIIFEKLVRNIKQELDYLEIENFNKEKMPYITMEVNYPDDLEIEEDKVDYIARYLAGEETDNPVYFTDDDVNEVGSTIILEEEKTLDRFNKMADLLTVE